MSNHPILPAYTYRNTNPSTQTHNLTPNEQITSPFRLHKPRSHPLILPHQAHPPLGKPHPSPLLPLLDSQTSTVERRKKGVVRAQLTRCSQTPKQDKQSIHRPNQLPPSKIPTLQHRRAKALTSQPMTRLHRKPPGNFHPLRHRPVQCVRRKTSPSRKQKVTLHPLTASSLICPLLVHRH